MPCKLLETLSLADLLVYFCVHIEHSYRMFFYHVLYQLDFIHQTPVFLKHKRLSQFPYFFVSGIIRTPNRTRNFFCF